MIDHGKLEAFVAVAEEVSFSDAATRMRAAQSTISARVKELEAQLGHRLFIRTSRRVRLSACGEAALPAARAALSALAGVQQATDDAAGTRRGTVSLGLVAGTDIPELGATLAAFTTEFPGIELRVSSASSSALERSVAEGELDIAVVVRAHDTHLRWDQLLCNPLSVVGLPDKHATAPISALAKQRLIVLDAGAGAREILESCARQAGIQLDVAIAVSTPQLARELHELAMGLLVVPQSLAPAHGAVLVDDDSKTTNISVGLISHPEARTPVTELLLEHLLRTLRTDS
ncbi:LysR family transcriptional regulator [Brevibacterium picturae]|uniref:LysR substrate-binding domain-containing protein n=1 Tax=Brevibacterium picturae TaxID=260553 RepID=A0ABP4NN49_9MICO